MGSVKGIIILVVACLVVGLSLLLQPWSELGFGFDEQQVPEWAQPIVKSDLYQHILKPYGEQAKDYLTNQIKGDAAAQASQTTLGPLVIGNYMYSLVLGGALVLAAIAIILIGKEEAEEKTILPVKK